MTINECVKAVHDNAVEHGWWEEDRNFGEIIALCTSELSEALEEDRAGRPMVWHMCEKTGQPCTECLAFEYGEGCTEDKMKDKPEGIAVEMADCVIRIFDWAGRRGLDFERIIKEKMAYNKTRPWKHGKKY